MEKVIAVVVTYNRQTLLSACIASLRLQSRRPDAILVVNNGSTDSTEQWLKKQPDVFYINQKNTGSSGGFSTGIRWAYDKGYSWAWCMDDDGYPREDALENLLKADDGQLRLLNCAVIDKADKQSFVWNTKGYKKIGDVKEKIIEGIGHPFNGTLLHRRVIERVGVPKPKFFLWGDETEYYYRIVRKNQIPVCTVADSVHYHPSTSFSIRQDWDYQNGWKMYFYIRNRFHIHRVKFGYRLVALLHYCCFLAAFAGTVLIFQKTNKIKKLGFIMWPALDAFTYNFEATPAVILNRLKDRSSFSLANILNSYGKSIRSSIISPFTSSRGRRAANA